MKEQSLTLIHPYDDETVIAGQGTVALEMLEDAPSLDLLLIPVGGGGLIAGCAVAAKALRPDIQVFGVQTSRFAFMRQALQGLPCRGGGDNRGRGNRRQGPGTAHSPYRSQIG